VRNTFQERITPKSIEIDTEKLHMKFLALNVDFDGPSLDFLCSRKPVHKGIKQRYPRKSRYFAIVGQSFVKTVANRHGHAAVCCLLQQALVMSFLVVSTSMTLKDPGLIRVFFIFVIFGCCACKNELRQNGWR